MRRPLADFRARAVVTSPFQGCSQAGGKVFVCLAADPAVAMPATQADALPFRVMPPEQDEDLDATVMEVHAAIACHVLSSPSSLRP
jgi:hypothetical protein